MHENVCPFLPPDLANDGNPLDSVECSLSDGSVGDITLHYMEPAYQNQDMVSQFPDVAEGGYAYQEQDLGVAEDESGIFPVGAEEEEIHADIDLDLSSVLSSVLGDGEASGGPHDYDSLSLSLDPTEYTENSNDAEEDDDLCRLLQHLSY